MSADDVQILDLGDPDTKRRLMAHVGALKPGVYEVGIRARRATRTLRQNAYYWQCVVTPWLAWLRDSEGDPSIDKEQAHEMLKAAVLPTKWVTLPDGRRRELPPRTRGMKTDEFTNYVEGAAKFLAEFAGIVVLSPEQYHGSTP